MVKKLIKMLFMLGMIVPIILVLARTMHCRINGK